MQERTTPAPDRPGRALHAGIVAAVLFHGLQRQARSLLPLSADTAELFPMGIAPCGKDKGDVERGRRGRAGSCWLARTRRLQCQAHPKERDKSRIGTRGRFVRLGTKGGSRRCDSMPRGFLHTEARG